MKKQNFLILAVAFMLANPLAVLADNGTPSSASATAGAQSTANASPTFNVPITVSPQTSVTANPIAGAQAGANAQQGQQQGIAFSPTINGGNTTVSPSISGGNSSAGATANPVVSPTISPVINPSISGGNSSAEGGNAASTSNANLTGTVTGNNTLNGNVSGSINGTNTNDVRNNNANISTIGVHATTGNNTNTVRVENGPITVAPIVNAKGGAGGEASAQSTSKVTNSGNSDSKSKSSATGGNVSNTGNGNGSGNSFIVNNPKPLPPAPGVVTPNASAPTLFNQYGLPANAKGLDLALRFMRACPSTYVKGSQLHEVREKGRSGLTNLIFTPHSNYAKYGNGKPIKESQVVEVPANAKVGEYRYMCLGLIQSEALASKASDVPIQTIMNDAVRFAGDELEGFDEIDLVYIPKESLSVNMGLNADGKGFGLSPGASGVMGAVLGTLSLGISTNSGYTFPAAQLGGTFLVVAKGSFPESAPSIDFAPPTPIASEAEKQFDAMKAELEKAKAELADTKAKEESARMALLSASGNVQIEVQKVTEKSACATKPRKYPKHKKVASPDCKH